MSKLKFLKWKSRTGENEKKNKDYGYKDQWRQDLFFMGKIQNKN